MSEVPDDFGKLIFRDGDWVLFRDYTTPAWTKCVSLSHDCHGRVDGWRQIWGHQSRKHKTCSSCGERIPDEMRGMISLANWGTRIEG